MAEKGPPTAHNQPPGAYPDLAETESLSQAKRDAIATLSTASVIDNVNRVATSIVTDWLQQHDSDVRKLAEEGRQAYYEIQRTASAPEVTRLYMPNVIEWRKRKAEWDKHLYVNSDGRFTEDLNNWETPIISEELKANEVVGWLRNVPRKSYSLCVPYESSGLMKPFFPDFIVFRQGKHGIRAEILDPHRIDLEDAAPKAAGLAKFVDRHPAAFGQVIMMIVDGGKMKRLDLVKEDVRNRVRGVQTSQHLRDLYSLLSRGNREGE